MKKRKGLSEEQANYFGFTFPPIEERWREHRHRFMLNDEQVEELSFIKNSGIIEDSNTAKVDFTSVKNLWKEVRDEDGNKKGNLFIKNPLFKEQAEKNLEQLKKDIIEELKKYAPKYPTLKRVKNDNGHLLIIDIADLHINKYATSELTGDEYNTDIAVQRAIEGTKGLLQKTVGYNVDKILFVIGNDVLNTDNLTKSTTKNTPQDTDTHWLTAFKIAKECYIKCIELCAVVADVDVVHCPSNHDLMSGCFLAETVSTHFRLAKNITFNISSSYRKYYKYYKNLIELEHGDKGKMAELPLLVAQAQPVMWAETKFRYGYLHHVHHSDKRQFQSSKDYIGFNVTYLRSPSSADIWHADSSYLNMVAVESFLHSKENGRVAHFTHYF